MFASYFEKEVFIERPDSLPFHTQITTKAEQIKERLKQQKRMRPPEVTNAEVRNILKNLPNSSPGADLIHNRSLRNYTKSLISHLVNIFNAVISIGYIPSAWKNANIILLLKAKKKENHPASYRPISLLSCLGKVLEKIIITTTPKTN